MKRRIVIGSIMTAFLIAFIPVTTAIQIQTVEYNLTPSYISNDAIKNMTDKELVVFISALVQDYLQTYEKFQDYVDDMEDTLVSSIIIKQVNVLLDNKNQDPQQTNDNQTMLEKIFWNIFKYRAVRVAISLILYEYTLSKIILWRTMTWGIRLLRWLKIGILLGIINPNQQNPYTPTINFEQDMINKTLTVLSVNPDSVIWETIAEIGEGSCDPLPEGVVTVGDTLTNCTGIIVLNYLPTDEILGIFEFD
ncbi:hypothetical protein AYK25_02825 [Thermoplasmatales archaeon SM1-50]|nr:MAG: hypothetical protein AYK25_02825 [Thermoplasmatales archaeon SM1-50]